MSDHLAGAVRGVLDVLLDRLDIALAADERAGRPRRRDLQGVAQQKAIALPAHRGEIAGYRGHIAQGLANLVHTDAQHRISDVRAGPHVLAQLRFGHEAPGMRHEIAQQRQGLGPQGDHLVTLPQVALRVIQVERAKREMVLLPHRVSCVAM
jgi:hypothetical protein